MTKIRRTVLGLALFVGTLSLSASPSGAVQGPDQSCDPGDGCSNPAGGGVIAWNWNTNESGVWKDSWRVYPITHPETNGMLALRNRMSVSKRDIQIINWNNGWNPSVRCLAYDNRSWVTTSGFVTQQVTVWAPGQNGFCPYV
jgi:hypothetical protein